MKLILATCVVLAGLAVVFAVTTSRAQTGVTPKHKALMITRIYTGPDGQSHAEEIEANFTLGSPNDIFKLMATGGGELHRAAPGSVQDWHVAPRRQYVITLSGEAELEMAGGKTVHEGPGRIDLVEDTTGKGHLTRTTGTVDRISIALPLVDQSSSSSAASR